MKEQIGALILAAGQGTRMKTNVAKQFLELKGKPLISYSLEAFEKSPVQEIILVTRKDEVNYCQEKIIHAFGYSKVKAVIPGGKERIDSVYEGLNAFYHLSDLKYVLIHDGARPFVTEKIISRAIEGAVQYEGCVVGMPVKDTIKISDKERYGVETPDRRTLWQIQTPQAFSFPLIYRAYQEIMNQKGNREGITDDAMVMEMTTSRKVKLIEGDYRNIKVTTPEDMIIAEAFLTNFDKNSRTAEKVKFY